MSDYFDRLESELRAAVPRAVSRPTPSRRRVRFRAGELATAMSAAVTVAVVVLAVGLAGHAHNGATQSQRASKHAVPPAVLAVPTLHQLLVNFAVLRRPQTAADRSWLPEWDPKSVARRLPRLTRLARTLRDGDRVFLTVEQFRTPYLGQAAGTYSLSLWVVNRRGDTGGTNFGPNVGYLISPLEFPAPGRHTGRTPTWTSLVPDGVSGVSWTFACVRATKCLGHGALTVRLAVHNNIASTTAPETDGCLGAGAACRPPTDVIWYGENGRVIKSYPGRTMVAAAAPFIRTTASPAGEASASRHTH